MSIDQDEDITIKAIPRVPNCLYWQLDCLAIVTERSLRRIQVAPRTHITRPLEIVPQKELENIKQPSGDSICLAETQTEIRIIAAACSPAGVDSNGQSCIALLTSGNRVGLYIPARDPLVDAWKVIGVLGRRRPGIDGLHNARQAAEEHRFSCMVWTPALKTTGSPWGQSYLVTGDYTGEVAFHHLTSSGSESAFVLKCSEACISIIEVEHTWHDGKLLLVVCDDQGAIYLVHVISSASALSVGAVRQLIPATGRRCTAVSIHTTVNICTLAIAFPGRIDVIFDATTEPNIQSYLLDFYSPVSGLQWVDNDQGTSIASLIVLGVCARRLVLQCQKDYSITIDADLSTQLDDHMNERMKAFMTTAIAKERYEFRYHGLAVSPASVMLAISYSIVPMNRITYNIAATEQSKVTLLKLSSPNQQHRLSTLCDDFIMDPYRNDSRIHTTLYRSLDLPMTVNHTYPIGHPSLETLFSDQGLNVLRLKLMDTHSRDDHESSISTLKEHLFTTILTHAQHYSNFDDRSAMLLKRILKFANSVSSISKDSLSPRLVDGVDCDSCPACGASIAIENEDSGTCLNNHTWMRCSVTFEILGSLDVRTCLDCARKYIALPDSQWTLISDLMGALEMCYYCTGKFYRKANYIQ